MRQRIRIGGRFCGPPGMGNGGYVAGRVAAALEARVGAPASVTLRRPTPLDTDLTVEEAASGGLRLLDPAGALIAEASPVGLGPIEPPVAPDREEAEAASRRCTAHGHHLFPGCFVCGTARAPGDGLRIFAGPYGEGGVAMAAPWRPDASLGAADGRVDPAFLWAALDCPGYFAAFPGPPVAGLLGRMAAVIAERPRPGDDLVVVAWPIDRDGRKRRVGTALFRAGEAGALAVAEALWIELVRQDPPTARP